MSLSFFSCHKDTINCITIQLFEKIFDNLKTFAFSTEWAGGGAKT
jgi:hypothetical protein